MPRNGSTTPETPDAAEAASKELTPERKAALKALAGKLKKAREAEATAYAELAKEAVAAREDGAGLKFIGEAVGLTFGATQNLVKKGRA